jgi:hypothetical protein
MHKNLVEVPSISAANLGPNRFHQARTVSWLISTPRSWSKSSTCRSESGNRTYIITAKRMISGDVLKYRHGFLIRECYETAISGSSEFPLTLP